ncbi:MAG: hypothetical protein EB116_13495, partial [Betaproteobacteria bacterium]|nr:hypothetical protein [Betaproteobacteria bacterium]
MSLAASYNAARNVAQNISFVDLADQLGVSDFEDVVVGGSPKYNAGMKFRIEDILNGTVSKGGTQLSVGSTFNATETITYNAGNNVTGTITAFKVSVQDKDGLGSSQIATVTVAVSGNNAPPTVGVSTATLSAPGTQKQAFTISYSTLATALTLADADSATKMFVITNISGGQLFNGSTLVTSHGTAPNQTPTPVSSTRLLVGETLTFIPDAATVGLTEIFQVRGYDGVDFSNNVRVSVNFGAAYSVPTISTVNDFTGLTQGQDFYFNYDQLKLKTDVSSPDANSTYPVKFKITSLGSGVLKRITSAVGVTPEAYQVLDTTTNNMIAKDERFVFSPTAGAYGRFKGFGIAASQQNAGSTIESVNSVDVNFVAGKVNALPVFSATAGNTPIPNGVEDVPLIISYNDLATYYGATDAETGALTYQIVSLPANSSTYVKKSGGTTTTILAAPVDINPGDTITWTPPLNADTTPQTIFTVKVKDGDGALSATSQVVQATMTAVNDTPIYGSPIVNLAGSAKNANVTFTYANVVAAIPYSDVEGDAAEYRIESLGSGSLYLNNTTTTAITAQTSRLASAASGDKVTSLTWVPPNNGVGEFVIAQVRLCDANSCSPTVRDLKI